MAENSDDFKSSIKTTTPNTQEQETIDPKEVENIASYFNNMLDDYSSGELYSDKCRSRDFIKKVIKHLKNGGHDTPKAIFNLRERHTEYHRQILWCTYHLKDIAYLCNHYDFVSKDDALECKRQLQQLKEEQSKKEYVDTLLIQNIERALSDVEDQLRKFDDLSKKPLIPNNDLVEKNTSFEAKQFLEQFNYKFIPFELKIKTDRNRIIDSTKKMDPNITVDIVNSPVSLKKEPVRYHFSPGEQLVQTAFDVMTSDNKTVARVDLRLTSSGEIVFQHIKYYNSDNLEFIHSKYTEKHNPIPYECFDFKKGSDNEYETLTITQVDTNVVGAYYSKKNNSSRTFLTSSLFTKPNFSGYYFNFPYKAQCMDGDLLKYQATVAVLIDIFKLDKNCSIQELRDKLKKYKGTIKCTDKNPVIDLYTIENHIDYVTDYLEVENENHYNLLKRFIGNYKGSIYKDTINPNENSINKNSYPMVVVTEQIHNDNTYRYYTLFEYHTLDCIRDAIKEAQGNGKKYIVPKYVTKIVENGEEELAFYDGQPISKLDIEKQTEAEANYTSFVKEFITPLSGIQRVYIEQFMQNSRDLSDEQR